MVRTLVVTNDLPPRRGGIQTFVHEILRRLDPDSFAVFGPAESGSAAFDASAGYEVHRYSGSVIPTPRVAKAVAEVAAATGAGQIMLGSGMPNAYLIPLLRRHDLPTALVITHGNEAGWAQLPGGRTLVQPLNGARAVTYLGDFTYRILSRYIQPATKLHRLSPGVDTDRCSPGSGGADFRRRHNLSDAFVIGTLTRLVPRKGVDLLIRALPYVRRAVPDAHVLVAGDGPHRRELKTSPASYLSTIGSSSQDQCPSRNSPRHTTRWMFSLCPPTPADGEWTSKVWESSSWKLRQPGCRSSSAIAAAASMLCRTELPEISLERIRRQLPRKSSNSRATRPKGARWGPAVVNGWWTSGSG